MVLRIVFKVWCIIITIVLFFSAAFAHKDSNIAISNESQVNANTETKIIFEEPEKKDPFIAAILSWSWSGLGQFYTQNYKKGSAFLLADMVEKGLFIYMLFHISDTYSYNDDSVRWSDISKKDQAIVIGLLSSIFLTRVLSVVDAVNSAHYYNRSIYYPYWKSKQRFGASYEYENKIFNLYVSYPVSLK